MVSDGLALSELLSAWEGKFGLLSESQRAVFESRREVNELCSLPRRTVLASLDAGPRLKDIRKEAIRLEKLDVQRLKSFDAYPESWVRLVRKYETDSEMALGALAFRASLEERRGRVKTDDPRKSLEETEKREGATALEKGIEIVGESFYGGSFIAIRRNLAIEAGSEKVLHGKLRNEPGNPHSLSGKAVQVLAAGKKVGYLPERLAPGVFGILEPDDGEMDVLLRVWFDYEENTPQRNSVRLLGKAEVSGNS